MNNSANIRDKAREVHAAQQGLQPSAAPGPIGALKLAAAELGMTLNYDDNGEPYLEGEDTAGKWYLLDGDDRVWKAELADCVARAVMARLSERVHKAEESDGKGGRKDMSGITAHVDRFATLRFARRLNNYARFHRRLAASEDDGKTILPKDDWTTGCINRNQDEPGIVPAIPEGGEADEEGPDCQHEHKRQKKSCLDDPDMENEEVDAWHTTEALYDEGPWDGPPTEEYEDDAPPTQGEPDPEKKKKRDKNAPPKDPRVTDAAAQDELMRLNSSIAGSTRSFE